MHEAIPLQCTSGQLEHIKQLNPASQIFAGLTLNVGMFM
jgi:hypothetical protein